MSPVLLIAGVQHDWHLGANNGIAEQHIESRHCPLPECGHASAKNTRSGRSITAAIVTGLKQPGSYAPPIVPEMVNDQKMDTDVLLILYHNA